MATYSNLNQPNTKEPEGIQIDGFQHVLDMLKSAEPAFRESLLKRLAVKDRELVRSLRRDLDSRDR